MDAMDPYDDVREDIDRLFKEAEALRARLKELVGVPPKKAAEDEATWVLRELAPCLADLDEHLAQLAAAVQVTERKKATFRIDPAEIGRRKDWVQSSKGRLLELNTSVQQAAGALKKADLWDSLRQKVRTARDPPPNTKDPVAGIRAGLDVGSSTKAVDLKGKGVAGKEFEAHNDPYEPHEKLVTDQLELQRMQLQDQDGDLDALHGSVKRLGQVGLAIRDELGQQEVLLEELEEESGALQAKLRRVQSRMDKVAADMTLRSKLCVIVILVTILFVLLLILLYT